MSEKGRRNDGVKRRLEAEISERNIEKKRREGGGSGENVSNREKK